VYGTTEGVLFARPFDTRAGRLTGEPVRLAEGLSYGAAGAMPYTVASAANAMAYLGGSGRVTPYRLAMVDRGGVERMLEMPPAYYQYPRISPDQSSLTVTIPAGFAVGQSLGNFPDIWLFDLRSRTLSRVTTDSGSRRAVWSADGASIAYVRSDSMVMKHPMSGGGSPVPIVRPLNRISQISLGQPGGVMALEVNQARNETRTDIYVSPMDSVGAPRALLAQSYSERDPQLSRDGALLAYVSNRTGRDEVYVRTIDARGSEISVSAGGGSEPSWSVDGRELFYRSPTHLMAAQIARPQLGVPRRDTLFRDRYARAPSTANYDVFADGQRFVMVPAAERSQESRPITMRVNLDLPRAGTARRER
jgi:serine/threonine-protein kinase